MSTSTTDAISSKFNTCGKDAGLAGNIKFNFAGMCLRIILLFHLFLASKSEAQIRHMFDSLKYDLSREKSFFISLDGKNSIIRDLPVKMFGIQAGYSFNKRTNLYLGFYFSRNDDRLISNPTAAAKGLTKDSNSVWQKFHLAYVNAGCDYYFYNKKKWRLSIPVALGIGKGTNKTYKMYTTIEDHRYVVVPFEIGFYATYKISWWIWAGAGMGTRVSLVSPQFNGPFYTYGLSLRFEEIYKRFNTWYKKQ